MIPAKKWPTNVCSIAIGSYSISIFLYTFTYAIMLPHKNVAHISNDIFSIESYIYTPAYTYRPVILQTNECPQL